MLTRYQRLRRAVADLAADADAQAALLEGEGETGGQTLARAFHEAHEALWDMHGWGELSREEVAALRPLDDLLLERAGEAHADFWRREALWNDRRWDDVRGHARQVLAQLPDEVRDTGWLASQS